MLKSFSKVECYISLVLFFLTISGSVSFADMYVNVLAVNSTEKAKEQYIEAMLPSDLTKGDILDTDGLELDYNVDERSYYVHADVSLEAKESKTYKVLVRDIWKIDSKEVEDIKKQIDESYQRIQETEYSDRGDSRKASLHQRLDTILEQQKSVDGNIERRIDRFRIYRDEFDDIRTNAVSPQYWRAKTPAYDDSKKITFIIELENESTKSVKTISQEHYLPAEVKPEHLINVEEFRIQYDPVRRRPFLSKEEELPPGEKRRYEVGIIDVWNIAQEELDSLKDRTRPAYAFLKETEYKDTAAFLVKNIKDKLERIELSQQVVRPIKEHISAHRENEFDYEDALKDVESLEEILNVVRENLERSRLKNVLQRIRSLTSLAAIAEAVIGSKPQLNNAWKIIVGILIFVGILTAIHFSIWGKRSREAKLKKAGEDEEEEKEEEKEEV